MKKKKVKIERDYLFNKLKKFILNIPQNQNGFTKSQEQKMQTWMNRIDVLDLQLKEK